MVGTSIAQRRSRFRQQSPVRIRFRYPKSFQWDPKKPMRRSQDKNGGTCENHAPVGAIALPVARVLQGHQRVADTRSWRDASLTFLPTTGNGERKALGRTHEFCRNLQTKAIHAKVLAMALDESNKKAWLSQQKSEARHGERFDIKKAKQIWERPCDTAKQIGWQGRRTHD